MELYQRFKSKKYASNSHGAELKYYYVSENEKLVLRCDCQVSLIRDTTSKHCFAAIVNEEAIVAISSLPGTKESTQNCILQQSQRQTVMQLER